MLQMLHSPAERPPARPARVLAWTLLALVLLDLAIGALFPVPVDPRVPRSRLQMYFDYGRSLEGKLRAMVAADDEHSALIVRAGWIDEVCDRSIAAPNGALGISIYGNSFAQQLSDELKRLDRSLSVTLYAGPGAPPNHSYACFVKASESERDRNPVQVIGVTTTSLPRMESIWGVTTSFEYPQPFTYPRYRLSADGELSVHEPSVRSPDDLRRILADRAAWNAWLAEVEAEDAFYSPSLTVAVSADHSVIGRMVRRSFGQAVMRERTEKLRGADGKITAPGIVEVLPRLIGDFAQRARRAGQQPIVVLFEEYGQSGVLERMLKPGLIQQHIDYVSSADVAPANDLRNFAPDGHFTPEVNAKLAQAVVNLVRRP